MATRVGWVLDPELAAAALVIVDEDSGDTLEIQREITSIDGSSAPAKDTSACLVRDGATHYGGLLSSRVTGDSLVLELSHEAADVLELPTSFAIELGPEGAALATEHLPFLLADSE